MWVLFLNDMRSDKYEYVQPALRAETREEILDFLKQERVETYKDGRFSKSFRQGGPLEWCNPPFDSDLDDLLVDTREHAVEKIESVPLLSRKTDSSRALLVKEVPV